VVAIDSYSVSCGLPKAFLTVSSRMADVDIVLDMPDDFSKKLRSIFE